MGGKRFESSKRVGKTGAEVLVVDFGFLVFGWFFLGNKLEPSHVGCYGRVERWGLVGCAETVRKVRWSWDVLHQKFVAADGNNLHEPAKHKSSQTVIIQTGSVPPMLDRLELPKYRAF
jgi:hypothetical protein